MNYLQAQLASWLPEWCLKYKKVQELKKEKEYIKNETQTVEKRRPASQQVT